MKRENIMDILPMMINRFPELEPERILGKEVIRCNRKELIKIFPFLKYTQKVRKIIYSLDTYHIKCLWCGIDTHIRGLDIVDYAKEHKCENPLFTIIGNKSILRCATNNKKQTITITSIVNDRKIVLYYIGNEDEYEDNVLFIKESIDRMIPIKTLLVDIEKNFKIENV